MLKLRETTMLKCLMACVAAIFSVGITLAQESAKPTEHFIGTVTAVDTASHTVTVKEDKTGTEQEVSVGNTRTLLKVTPGAKDLKNAVRITADDLQVGDRVDVRGTKLPEDPKAITARSVVLMSGRDLQKAHQAEAEAWQHSTTGVVTSVDAAAGKLNITERTPSGIKPVTVTTAATTAFTRYSPENPNIPAKSELMQIQPGDRVRIIGTKNEDGSAIAAEKIYSGAFRTVNGTVSSISPDGKSITIKDLATKKPVEIALNDQTEIRKLPPMMAMMLARRFNPNFRHTPGGGGSQGEERAGGNGEGAAPAAERSGPQGDGSRAWGVRAGSPPDVAQMIQRLPAISTSDLKEGDAVVVSGVAVGEGGSRLQATSIIAGVEPILQAAPARSGGGQAMGGDWGLGEMSIPQ
jgi:transcription antitermination factor NusG